MFFQHTSDLEHRHLGIRNNFFRATAEFRHLVRKYAFEFLDDQNCMLVQTPILTNASCVCSGDVFTFPYYGKQVATLIQSPWMYADALVSGVERVYALNPSFRRETDATGIHLVEIWQLQVDLAWASNDEIMQMEQDLIHFIAEKLKKHTDLYAKAQLGTEHLDQLLKPFARITYDESVTLLNELGYLFDYGNDYTEEHNNAIGKHVKVPYFITDFPMSLKNFWFAHSTDNYDLSPSNDLFSHMGQGEIVGGGTRVSDYEELKANLEYFGHDLDEFAWFVDIRRHGCVPHSGFSIGFDRLVATFMGVNDIRQATLFPRIPQGLLKP
ncbi:amino acid--tRNA ligase-related protein [Acinetobacter genomosp. 15BJ]|uniref:Amino acid--tRNA ligase-related protein n=1 Tax=Acinetobacter genomosp. 15BJ TaxID=106651 RepID=A0ABT8V1N8_9GAMM|nr:amino acid--tRNA ligase-related protein [Acinetobacter genomosp. 15BJ]MDO3659219.1 amino acid--tRNA ligase-related protein [Acinetobacter genomosp. 15BJ]